MDIVLLAWDKSYQHPQAVEQQVNGACDGHGAPLLMRKGNATKH